MTPMTRPPLTLRPIVLATLVGLAALHPMARAADDDALDLQAAPPADTRAAAADTRLMLEMAAITARTRLGGGREDGRRASADVRLTRSIAPGWQVLLSDRLDDIHPVLEDQRSTRNSLREAVLSWQGGQGSSAELGRLNQRHGPAYGFNPTDYFRAGATRTVVTADPVALRENRVGTFMLRGSQQWDGAGVSAAWAPKLSSRPPSDAVWSLDLGASNPQQRLLLSATAKASARWSGEGLLLLAQGDSARVGANVSGLLTDSLVAHGEWSSGRSLSLLDQALGQGGIKQRVNQVSTGLTWTLPGGLAITGEAEYNSAGLDQHGWQTLWAQGPVTIGRFFGSSQANQDLSARRAWLVYATKKGALAKQLDLTAFVRQNAIDHSTLAWAEARYHFPRLDLALQVQQASHRVSTEYAALPYRQVIQLVAQAYF